MQITRRPATQEDGDYLWWLHVHTIRPYVELTWGWDEEWQRRYFWERFEPERLEIIEVDGAPAGCISVEQHKHHIFLASSRPTSSRSRRATRGGAWERN